MTTRAKSGPRTQGTPGFKRKNPKLSDEKIIEARIMREHHGATIKEVAYQFDIPYGYALQILTYVVRSRLTIPPKKD